MKPNTVALSTAKSDPQWFHHGWDKSVVYEDKNGVLNGLRAEPFVPQTFENAEGYCGHCDKNPIHCKFIKAYRQQLSNLDFDDMMRRFKSIAERVVKMGKSLKLFYLFMKHRIILALSVGHYLSGLKSMVLMLKNIQLKRHKNPIKYLIFDFYKKIYYNIFRKLKKEKFKKSLIFWDKKS